jgi:hypothetical protein
VERDEDELAWPDAEACGRAGVPERRLKRGKRVDHRVPDEVDALVLNSFAT